VQYQEFTLRTATAIFSSVASTAPFHEELLRAMERAKKLTKWLDIMRKLQKNVWESSWIHQKMMIAKGKLSVATCSISIDKCCTRAQNRNWIGSAHS
jgi:hypothetical protein